MKRSAESKVRKPKREARELMGFQPRKVKPFKFKPLAIKEKLPPPPKYPVCPVFGCFQPTKVAKHIIEGTGQHGGMKAGVKYEVKTQWCPNCGWGGSVYERKELKS